MDEHVELSGTLVRLFAAIAIGLLGCKIPVMTEYAGKIAYYITPHGFGHAVRSLEVIRQLLVLESGLEIIVVSDLPDALVEQNARCRLRQRRQRLDVGLVQQDSVRFDLDATRAALERLYSQHAALVAEEIQFWNCEKIDAIVSDVSFLPFYAAFLQGIPAIGLGNFTWDWIYQAYIQSDSRWQPLVAWIQEGYRRCRLFLRLPMHGDCSICPRLEDVPLVTRRTLRTPDSTREILGCLPGQKAYLISFASLNLNADATRHLEEMEHAVFFFKDPLQLNFRNGRSLDGFASLSYPDVVAAVDGVITKPGYGIVADCLAHGTPVIYTDRGLFPEYPVLVREMERRLTTVYLPSQALYRGQWGPAIREIEGLARRYPRIRDDGAAVCAKRILREIAS